MSKYRKRRYQSSDELAIEDAEQLITLKQAEIKELKARLEQEKQVITLLEKYIQGNITLKQGPPETKISNTAAVQPEQPHLPHPVKPVFHNHWTWKQKILFVLEREDKPLLSSQIIKHLEAYQQDLFYHRDAGRTISAHLNKLMNNGYIATFKKKLQRGYYFVLPGWKDSSGRIKQAYLEKIDTW